MIHIISQKPILGFIMTGTGVAGWLVSEAVKLTPILGFGAALFGFAAGGITLYVKLKEFKAWKKAQKKHGKRVNWWNVFDDFI